MKQLKQAAEKLKQVGVETPELDACILLELATGKTRTFFIAHTEYELTPAEQKLFDELIKRRINREPISQILGKREFYGRDFVVSQDVLTPRPETELIIDAVKKLYVSGSKFQVLDLGTGSGCILLTILQEFSNSKGVGVDKSQKALAIAKQNAYNFGVNDAEFVLSEWCENLDKQQKFDLIISNPPYIPAPEKTTLDKDLSFEPDMALFGGDDGLDAYRKIAQEIEVLDFKFAIFEIGINQENEVIKIFEATKLKHVETLKDLQNIPRTLVFKKEKYE